MKAEVLNLPNYSKHSRQRATSQPNECCPSFFFIDLLLGSSYICEIGQVAIFSVMGETFRMKVLL